MTDLKTTIGLHQKATGIIRDNERLQGALNRVTEMIRTEAPALYRKVAEEVLKDLEAGDRLPLELRAALGE